MTPSPDPSTAHDVPSRSVAHWLTALAAGADVVDDLEAARRNIAQRAAPGVWIHLCPDDTWAAQRALLQQRLAETADRAALL